jgi:hypothetical protein
MLLQRQVLLCLRPPPVGPYRGAMGGVFGHICCAINMVQTHRAEADGSEKIEFKVEKNYFFSLMLVENRFAPPMGPYMAAMVSTHCSQERT